MKIDSNWILGNSIFNCAKYFVVYAMKSMNVYFTTSCSVFELLLYLHPFLIFNNQIEFSDGVEFAWEIRRWESLRVRVQTRADGSGFENPLSLLSFRINLSRSGFDFTSLHIHDETHSSLIQRTLSSSASRSLQCRPSYEMHFVSRESDP